MTTIQSDMSLSVRLADSAGAHILEWASHGLSTFLGMSNLWKPSYWRMVWEVLRFNRAAPRVLDSSTSEDALLSVKDYLDKHGYVLVRFGANGHGLLL